MTMTVVQVVIENDEAGNRVARIPEGWEPTAPLINTCAYCAHGSHILGSCTAGETDRCECVFGIPLRPGKKHTEHDMRLQELTLTAVSAEYIRAHAKHKGRTPKSPDMTDGERLAILGEEFGEVCRALTYDEGDRSNLVKELIQLSAMAAAWAEQAEGS